jgi:GNAT superfamily N-acetyltransferase
VTNLQKRAARRGDCGYTPIPSRNSEVTVQDWRADVDHWWAGVLRVPAAAARTGGVFALGHVSHVGVVAVEGAAAPIVYGPAQVLPALHQAMRASHGDLAEGHHLAAALGPLASRVQGPAWYGYATAQTLGPAASQARPLREPDLPLLAALHERTSPAERDESGTTGLPAYGYLDDGELQAVACLGMWHGMPTIGVLTDPRARGRGLASLVVTAAAREGLSRRPVIQYRAWRRNTASIAVAVRCGFTHYCDGLVIDLGP